MTFFNLGIFNFSGDFWQAMSIIIPAYLLFLQNRKAKENRETSKKEHTETLSKVHEVNAQVNKVEKVLNGGLKDTIIDAIKEEKKTA